MLDAGLAGLERQPLLHEGAQREFIDKATINGWHGDASTFAAGMDRLSDRMGSVGAKEHRCLNLIDHIVEEEPVRFEANGVDDCVRTDAASHLHQRLICLRFFIVDGFRAEALR